MTSITTHDRAVALRWAHALENPVTYYDADLRAEFKECAQLLRRLVGVSLTEDRPGTPVSGPPANADLLSVPKAARLIGCHRSTVLLAILRGRLVAVEIGGRYFVDRASAEAFKLNAQQRTSVSTSTTSQT